MAKIVTDLYNSCVKGYANNVLCSGILLGKRTCYPFGAGIIFLILAHTVYKM